METDKIHPLVRGIDKAAELCGGQNRLADRLGTTSGAMSAARSGKRSLSKPQIDMLAKLLKVAPGELWLIAQDYRNPYGSTLRCTLIPSAIFWVMVAILAACWTEPAQGARTNDTPGPTASTEHDIHWRGFGVLEPGRRRVQVAIHAGPQPPPSWRRWTERPWTKRRSLPRRPSITTRA